MLLEVPGKSMSWKIFFLKCPAADEDTCKGTGKYCALGLIEEKVFIPTL
jgi:hypothetical protein